MNGINEVKKLGIDIVSNHPDNEVFSKEIGSIKLVVKTVRDDYPDFSYYGKYTDFDSWPKLICYHRRSGLAWDGLHWRNEKGQLQAEPENLNGGDRNTFQFITVGTDRYTRGEKDWFKYAMQDAKRLDRMDEDWVTCGIVATVFCNDLEVAEASVWGFEFELYNDKKNAEYYLGDCREIAEEALSDARKEIQRRKQQFAEVRVKCAT